MEPTLASNPNPPPEEEILTLPVIREHIIRTPDTCGGKPRIAGSRIQVKDVAVMHERMKMSPEQIVSDYPHLTLADIYAALAYYHDHREAIHAEIKADKEWYEEMRASAPSLLRDKFRQRKADAPDDSLPPR
jgi:uncharacterized protein (DUF433 family)